MALTFLIISVLSIVQSLFGIGLLVFGTPTLLLMGYPFPNTLAILLPAVAYDQLLHVLASHRQEPELVRLRRPNY